MDIHCHLLPGIDDGPRDLARAIRMARGLVAAGVGTVCATPHHSPRWPTTPSGIRRTAATLRAALAAEAIPLNVYAGCEVAHERMAALTDRTLRGMALGGGRFLLVEPPPRARVDLLPACERLGALGMNMVIAHPERAEYFQEDPTRLIALLARGARAQVTAGSLLGRHGARAQAAAEAIVTLDPTVLIASDAHYSRRRGPEVLTPALERLAELRGVNVRRARHHARELPLALLPPPVPAT